MPLLASVFILGGLIVSEPCCPLARSAKNGLMTFGLLAATIALVLMVLAPWRSVDAASPPVGDDLLTNGNFVRPVPSALESRGLHGKGSDQVLMLNNWHYTYNSDTF